MRRWSRGLGRWRSLTRVGGSTLLVQRLRAARSFVGALILVTCISNTTPVISGATKTSAVSPADRANLIRVAVGVRAAILRTDTRALVGLVSPSEGLECTDDRYTIAQVQRHLSRTSSVLYEGLFDAARFSRRCGASYPGEHPAISEKAFFESAPGGVVEIEFVKNGYATVRFSSPRPRYYPREYSFKKERGEWKLVEGPVIGSCACG